MNSFCKRIPKVELHAHLYGSIRATTLIELATERNAILPPEFLLHEEEIISCYAKCARTCWHTKVYDGWLVGCCAGGIITTTIVILLCQN